MICFTSKKSQIKPIDAENREKFIIQCIQIKIHNWE